MNKFKENLKRERIAQGMTQRQLADMLMITQASYSRYEIGLREPDLDDMLIKIADVLDISLDVLTGRIG